MINRWLKWIFEKRNVKNDRIAKILDENFPDKSYQQFIIMRCICFLGSLIIALCLFFYWKLSYLLLFPVVFISILISYVPYINLVIDGIFYEAELEDEISQVRLMTISLASVIGMTVEEILLWIENFTLFLRESVASCIDQLDVDENTALDRLRERWRMTSFINVIDDLIASDKIGINEAFKDLLSRRDYYTAKRRQEQELVVRKKEAIISTFLYLPFMVTVGVYMIVPFLVISIKNLLDVTVNLS